MNWYAIRVRSRHEKVVCSHLAGSGFDVYLPLVRSVRVWSDRKKEVEMPLFPGYFFVRCAMDSESRVRILSSSRGVVQIVGVGSRPAPVPDSEIESVRGLLESEAAVTPLDHFVRGVRVRVTSGPLEGIEGVVVRQKGKRRIICSVELLGRSVQADFAVGDVAPHQGR